MLQSDKSIRYFQRKVGKRYIIGNWKMNLTIHEASLLVHQLDATVQSRRNVEVVLAPSFLALQTLSLQIDHKKFSLAAQNCYWRDTGAFTGEVSAHQLRGLVQYVIVGHSERRHVFGESGRDIGRKVQAAVRNELRPILCVGETAFERQVGETNDVLHDQLVAGLANLTADDMKHVLIAYEPVWAISGGGDFASHKTATQEDCEQAAAAIRRQITHMFGKKIATETPVLYGGSVSQDNAATFLSADGIDGALVGGASLDAGQFSNIIEAANAAAKNK